MTTYVYTTFNGLSDIQDINNSGELVGGSFAATGFLYNSGALTTIDPDPSSPQSEARGINDSGQIVGLYEYGPFDSGQTDGFLYSNGTYTTLNDPSAGPFGTQAKGINNSGSIVGTYIDSHTSPHSFVYNNGIWTNLDYNYATQTFAYGINDYGQIVGSYVAYADDSYQTHGFLYSNGTWTTIDDPLGVDTTITGVNNLGQMVGTYKDADNISHMFLYSNGSWTTIDLGVPSETDAWVNGINDSGAIVGSYEYKNGSNTYQGGFVAAPAYSLTPTPMAASESDGTITFTLSRGSSASAEVVYVSTVQNQGYYNAASGTSSKGYYYGGLVNVPYTFLAGQTSIQVPITIYDHGLTSGIEKFSFEAQDASGITLASTTFTIANNDTSLTTYSVSPTPAAVNENAGTLIFTITRSDSSQQQTVKVRTVQDQGYYNNASGTTSTNYWYDGLADVSYAFAAGQSSIQVPITIHDRGLTLGSEKFGLDVLSTSGANVASTTFIILNSDPAPTTIQPSPTDALPAISGPSGLSALVNDSIGFSSSLSANDSDGSVAFYRFQLTSGTGIFKLDGTASGISVTVPAWQLSRVGFNTGASPGTDHIQVQAIDNEGAASTPLDVTVNVSARTGLPSAADAVTLAKLSADVYNDPSGADGFIPIPYDSAGDVLDAQRDGFAGAAYSNGSEIVIAIRGTNLSNLLNDLADASFKTGDDILFQSYFDDAVQLLQCIQTMYATGPVYISGNSYTIPVRGSNAAIELTGHSLGGALASLLGEAADLKVTAFAAPGAQQLYLPAMNNLDLLHSDWYNSLGSDASTRLGRNQIENIREWGDSVSYEDHENWIGTTSTLPVPDFNYTDPLIFKSRHLDIVTSPFDEVKGFVAGTIQAMQAGTEEPDIPESLVAGTAQAIQDQTGKIIGNVTSWVNESVSALTQYVQDPPGGTDFVYTQAEGSSPLSSIELPTLPGAESYEIRYRTGSSWSAFQRIWPQQWQAPGSEADGVEFVPLDSTGHSVSVTDSIIFGLVFGTSGTINATLESLAQSYVFGVPGNYTLIGNPGSDIFVFDATALAAAQAALPMFDRVTDFDQGNSGTFSTAEGDQLDLSALLASAYNLGSGQPVSSLVRAIEDASGIFANLQVDPDGAANGADWVTIARLDGAHPGNTLDVILDATLPTGAPINVANVNQPPSAVVLVNTTASIAENTTTSTHIKVADIAVIDDALGTNAFSLTGADAAFFEIVGASLFLKAGTVLDFEAKASYAVAVTVDDTSVGSTPDAISTTYTLAVTDVIEADSVSINDAAIVEGNTGTKTETFTVTRTGGTTAFDVRFATSDGSATIGNGDYVARSGTLHFGAGVNTQTIAVTIRGDTKAETDETFSVNLSGATNGAAISDGSGIGTIINDDAPTVAITGASGPTNSATRTIAGAVDTADAGSIVTVFEGASALGTGIVAQDGTWSAGITLPGVDGKHSLIAKDANAAGTGSSTPFTVTLDTAAPVVTIKTAGSLAKVAKLTVAGSVGAADAGTIVSLYDNGSATALATAKVAANGAWSAIVTLAGDGPHALLAKDTDAAGNTGSSQAVTFTLDTTPPHVTIDNVGGPTNAPHQTIAGSVTDIHSVGTQVTIVDGTKILGTAIVAADGTWSAGVILAGNGKHSLVAKDTDAAGNLGTSAPVVYTLDTVAPTVAKLTALPATGDIETGRPAAITLTFSEAVAVTGSPVLTLNDVTLNDGGIATFRAGQPASTSLVFDYTPASGQNTAKLQVTGVGLNGGTIADLAGNAANLAKAVATFGLAVNTVAWTHAVSASWSSANWTPSIPTADDNALLSAGGAYTVTSGSSVTVHSLTTARGATLALTGGTFTATAGTGAGANAGTVKVGDGASFVAGGPVNNTGTLSVVGAGTLTIDAALANAGKLSASAGRMILAGPVTGKGSATISGAGTIEIAQAASQNVTFAAGSTGTLQLDDARGYTGTVAGLSTINALDLGDIEFAHLVAPPSYAGTTARGVLTVGDTDGHTAKIALLGNYMHSTFTPSADSQGGTMIVDPVVAAHALNLGRQA